MSDPLAAELDRLSAQTISLSAQREGTRRIEEESKLRARLVRLQALFDDPNVQWFLETYLRPLEDGHERDCKDPVKAGLLGPVAANRYDVAHRCRAMLETERRVTENQLATLIRGRG